MDSKFCIMDRCVLWIASCVLWIASCVLWIGVYHG